jgi:hypothetical protein
VPVRPKALLAIILFLAGTVLVFLVGGLGIAVGAILIFGAGALLVREEARLDDRLPWWRVFFYGTHGSEPGPEIFIGPGRSFEADDPDRDQVRRDCSD